MLMIGRLPAVSLHLVSWRHLSALLPVLLLLLACGAVSAQPGLSAWGSNVFGQLGDGTQTERAVPVPILSLLDAVAIAAGGGHSLALTSQRTVLAWGRTSSGQLGNDFFEIDAPYGRLLPEIIPGLTDIVAIAAGNGHSLALTSDGGVYAWGHNRYGQIGNGIDNDNPTPFLLSNINSVTAIAAGMAHSLALKSDGTVWMWGHNGNGNLGDGTNSVGRPTAVPGPNGAGILSDMVAIAAGGFHSLALKSDGTVWAWGRNASGQLGDNTLDWRGTPVQVRAVNGVGISDVVAIAAGSDHSLALKADGSVWAWGRNSMGQLGNGTDQDSRTPVPVSGPGNTSSLPSIVAIAAGSFHNLALKADGTVWAWGYTRYGQTGNNVSGDDALGLPRFQPAPVQVSGLAGAVAIASGEFHLFALTTPAASVHGVVRLEGRASSAHLLTVTLRPTDGTPPLVRQIRPSANGSFRLTNVPRRGYRMHIKGPLWLSRVVTVNAAAGSVSGLNITLPAGDTNNDNRVDSTDMELLLAAFDTAENDPGYRASADFDGDHLISVLDLDLLLRNFSQSGDP
jgi:alpha-tubulin suppressor-like RCC1 family protein